MKCEDCLWYGCCGEYGTNGQGCADLSPLDEDKLNDSQYRENLRLRERSYREIVEELNGGSQH